jgi:putative hydrolase of the HAD superfamily
MDDPRVILFDLDDTIVDFSWNQAASWRTACVEFEDQTGVEVERLLTEIRAAGGRFWADHDRAERGRKDLRAASAEIVVEALEGVGVRVRSGLPREISERYRTLREEGMRLFEGTTEVLEGLRGEGRRLGLVTNGTGEEQRGKIERFGLERYFDHIQIEGEFGLGKPHDAAYRHALTSMGAEAATTWFVGDNLEWDVAAPQRHGMFGIWVDGSGQGVPEGAAGRPDRIVRHIGELRGRGRGAGERD